MTNAISRFTTITKHQSPLVTSPATITCLVKILKYIDRNISDETSNDLVNLITTHLDTETIPYPHYLNLSKINTNVIEAIYNDMVSSGTYTGTYEEFTNWLISSIGFYDSEIPINPDRFGTGLTLGITMILFERDHNLNHTVHENGIGGELNNLTMGEIVRSYDIFMEGLFIFSNSQRFDDEVQAMLVARTDLLVTNMTNPDPILNYNEHEDTSKAILSYEMAGTLGMTGVYDSFVLDYGEELLPLFNKSMNYYTDHLDYALASSMTQIYRDTITDIRGNVNTGYQKVFDFYTRIKNDSVGINAIVTINQFTDSKTLDLINLTGLSKSFLAISLEHYMFEGRDYNRLIVSFDNYNPNKTITLLDNISINNSNEVNVLLVTNKTEFIVYYAIGNFYDKVIFDRSDAMFNEDIRYLFVPAVVGSPKHGTLRLSSIDIYSDEIGDPEAMYIISGVGKH